MSLTSTSPLSIRSFSAPASTASSQILIPTSNSRSTETPSSTKATTTIGSSPVASEGGADGLPATSAVRGSSSMSTPSPAPSPTSWTFASARATNTPVPSFSRSTGPMSATTTAHREETAGLSSTTLTPELLTSSPLISTVSLSLPTTTTGPNLGARETHELVIDVGDCAEIGTPTLVVALGNQSNLMSLGDGKFRLVMVAGEQHDGSAWYSAGVFMADDGSRCGKRGSCVNVYVDFSHRAGISMRIARNGDQGLSMYPLSIWMDDAITWDARPASTPETASHCWGWTEEECPNSSTNENSPEWTIYSKSFTSRAFITFCPPNGPALSAVGPNPNPPTYQPGDFETWILLPVTTAVPISTFISADGLGVGATTVTEPAEPQPTGPAEQLPGCSYIFTCVAGNSFILEDQVSTVVSKFSGPLGAPSPLNTHITLETVATVTPSPFMGDPISQVLATITDSAGSAIVTTIQPSSALLTQDTFFNGLPSGVTAAPFPSQNYIVTSWTTWMEINGSTIPAIVGQAAIETTVPVTYALKSDTIIPVGALSSLSIESMRTASPSSTHAAARGEPSLSKQGAVIAAIVGTLVGLALGGILVWSVCCRRRKARSGDYLAQGSLSWGGSREGGLLDLDGGSREREVDREMVVEPWTLPVSVVRRKELESLGASTGEGSGVGECGNAGPSRVPEPESAESGPTSSQSQSQLQPQSEHVPTTRVRGGKSVTLRPAGPQPQLQAGSPSRSRTSQPLGPEQINRHDVALPHLSQPSLPTSSEATPPTHSLSRPRRTVNVEQYNAIPPLYNEEWRTTR